MKAAKKLFEKSEDVDRPGPSGSTDATTKNNKPTKEAKKNLKKNPKDSIDELFHVPEVNSDDEVHGKKNKKKTPIKRRTKKPRTLTQEVFGQSSPELETERNVKEPAPEDNDVTTDDKEIEDENKSEESAEDIGNKSEEDIFGFDEK